MPFYLESSHALRQRRLIKIAILISLVYAILIGRLLHLQVWKHEDLSEKAIKNYTQEKVLHADRGAIYDRKGRVLAMNRPSFDLYLTASHIRNKTEVLQGLSDILELDALQRLQMQDRIYITDAYSRRQPIRIARDLLRNKVSSLEALNAKHGGLKIKVTQQRMYPEGLVGAHVLGYLGQPNAEEVKSYQISPKQMIGRYGVEKLYDSYLRGKQGYQRLVVNAKGRKQSGKQIWAADAIQQVAVTHTSQRGNDLILSIDAQVQQIVYNSLANYKSASVVVMDPRTGELLAMVSKPSFDPNLWSGRLPSKVQKEVYENPYKPLLDKSVKSFFPGSLYKVVTALAAMEEAVLDPELPIDSPGAYEYGNRIFHCHKLSGHGRVDLNGAMAASADVYFYKLGERLGIDTLAIYGKHFGFGEKTLGLNGESAGVVPTKAYHDQHTTGGFQHGLSLSSAIGQGAVRTSPLQMAIGFSALANHGIVYKPQLVLRAQNLQGEVVKEWTPEMKHRLDSDPRHINMIRRSLERAVNDPRRATGYRAAVSFGKVAGKTGTAQVKSIIRGHQRQKIQRWRDRDHAWFAAFAPYESPRLTVIVFLEHGGSGGKDAAPIARKIIESYHQEVEPIFNTQASLDTRFNSMH